MDIELVGFKPKKITRYFVQSNSPLVEGSGDLFIKLTAEYDKPIKSFKDFGILPFIRDYESENLIEISDSEYYANSNDKPFMETRCE